MAAFTFVMFLIVATAGAAAGYGLGRHDEAKSKHTDLSPRLYRKAAEMMSDMINLNVVSTDEIPMLPPTIRTRVEDWLEEYRKHHEKRK